MTAEKTRGTAAENRAQGLTAGQPAETQVAAALRKSYQDAVQEEVPAEFMDLLGKLS